MHIVTDRISGDEECHGLVERSVMTELPGGGRGWCWIQSVFVIRGDTIAKYETDFGPAENFDRIQPLAIPSFGENTVAQLQELAEKNRHDDYWARRVDEMRAESTLIADHIRQLEQQQAIIANRSTFGAGVVAQRNGYPRKAGKEAHG